jgi:hypothetical protein
MKKILIFGLLCCFWFMSQSQDLMQLLDAQKQQESEKIPVEGTFKTVRLINGYTTEIAGKTDLVFSISHRFGEVTSGIYEFYGIDESTIRFGFEYGLSNRISLGLGRSNFDKLYDGFIKLKLIQQAVGGSPVTLMLMEGMAIKTIDWVNPDLDYPLSARFFYSHELFISRKFNQQFSAQIVPAVVHRNMVKTTDEQNVVPALGVGANYTVNKWLSLSAEYFHLLPGNTADNFTNSLAIGVEMETGGGHVFQVHLSNSHGMTEKAFIAETTNKWTDGDIQLGFNIIRVFHLKKQKK